MIYVVPPEYEHDEYRDIEKFKSISDALRFIEEDLKKNKDSTFTNTVDCYTVIEGHEIKVKAIEYASKVVVDKGSGNTIINKYDYPLVYSSLEERDIFESWRKRGL